MPQQDKQKELLPAMERQRSNTMPIIQTTTLLSIQDTMEEMLEALRLIIPHGEQDSQTFSIGPSYTELTHSTVITMPWKEFNLLNDGPADVFFATNKDYIRNPTPVKSNQPIYIDLGRDMVQKILLTTTNPTTPQIQGGTASCRIFFVK